MSRARATALVLVNWKGVFFERYLLDRHVTALEGANGAGKTTVMIAAYVVLLPDLTRLKFTNLGETGATGGDRGIYGRLGEPGPSYAALEIELEKGERLVMGVYLERKAAPSLSLTPFILSALPADAGVHHIFLRESESHEHVATMGDIEARSAEIGAKLEVFGSAKDYFTNLFERGVSPLRLGLDEERNKFNDMLRTSMTGGISRTLTSDLRSFLFKQQTGLFDTLTRMRKNLEACRRTRVEVSEARVLEHEINGIYTAGHAMFEAALEACRRQASERREAAQEARERLELERAQIDELRTRVREAESREQGLAPRVERAQKAEDAARQRLVQATRALAAAERLTHIDAERRRILPEVELAREAQAEAAAARQRAKAQRDGGQQTLQRAASGLASLQAGLEELHREAHAHRQVRARLVAAHDALSAVDAQAAALKLPEPEVQVWLGELARTLGAAANPGDASAAGEALTADLLAEALRRIKDALHHLDRTRAERDRHAEVAERRRRDHSEARAALSSLCGELVERELGQRARHELGRLNGLELLGTRQGELSREWQRLQQLADRQRAVQSEVHALGFENAPSAREFMHELAELDAALLRAGEAQREHDAAAQRLGEREASSREALRALDTRVEAYQKLAAIAARLVALGLPHPETRADLNAALRASHETQSELARRGSELEQQRQTALARARQYEAIGSGVSPELARLAELAEGQLLAGRYEELELEDARRVQAELGPLANAIVVDDLQRAVDALLAEPTELGELWLLSAGAEWSMPPFGRASARLVPMAPERSRSSPERPAPARELGVPSQAVLVDIGKGVRIGRLPRDVGLGRAGRQRQAEHARGEAEAAGKALAALDAPRRDQAHVARELEALQEGWDTWALGDPSPERARLTEELSALGVERQQRLAQSREKRVELAGLAARRDALRAQLGDHHLLDPPDYASEAERMRSQLEQAKSAALELDRASDARRTLIALVHELADTPPDATAIDAWRRERPALEAQRDRLFAAAEALAIVSNQRTALGWTHAERALAERTELVPELEAQHERALGELEAAQLALTLSEGAWEQATAASQSAAAKLAAVDAHLGRARAELGAEGFADPSTDACDAARQELEQQGATLERLRREQNGIEAELALARERLTEAEKRHQAAQLDAERQRLASEPSDAAWRALAEAARSAHVLEPDAALVDPARGTSSTQRWLEAEGKRELLSDRLSAARGGAELGEAMKRRSSDAARAGMEDGQRFLAAWLEVRAWLLRRLPSQIAELGQPLLGLSRLRDDLSELETRLGRQEGELRGTSADVARSIDVQLRRASAQVKRLNRALDGVRFGSIHGMRVQLDRIEKMDQVLRALREGETQELLFQSNLPIEEALDEIFRRHAGGRTGGQRLIDYREYLELSVQIQRRAEQSWERVNPSQVSTGEAIGIGAALMMVILSEWERDDQLLRQKRPFGSLRFLFLDEANRLSQDNLGVLFDLCEVLDLQLLIAAPEVARAQGNTTYRLVRRISEDGLEEVLVTGRRASLPGVMEALAPESAEVSTGIVDPMAPGVAASEQALSEDALSEAGLSEPAAPEAVMLESAARDVEKQEPPDEPSEHSGGPAGEQLGLLS
jgi:chromosome partition protein MukB